MENSDIISDEEKKTITENLLNDINLYIHLFDGLDNSENLVDREAFVANQKELQERKLELEKMLDDINERIGKKSK